MIKTQGKLLIVSWLTPPSVSAIATVAYHLGAALGRRKVILAGEPPLRSFLGAPPPPDVDVVHLRQGHDGRGENMLRFWATPLVAWRIRKLIQERGCSSLLAIFPDETYLAAAWWAARQTKCRFYPYFHNTYLENRTGLRRLVARWLQPRVFESAKHVFVMSEGMVEFYRRNYPNLAGCSALVHTFCEPLPVFAEPPAPGPSLLFAFCGNLNASCLDAGRRLFRAVAVVPGAQFDICSGLLRSDFESMVVLPGRSSVQCVSRADLLLRLNRADILLLPHGFSGGLSQVEYETIFPTKTIEYLISGRPILAHTPPGVFLTRFLKQHDCALVVESKESSALAAAIDRLRTDAALRARLVRNALKAAELFQIGRVADHLWRLTDNETSNQD